MKLDRLFVSYLAALGLMFGGIIASNGLAWYQTLVLPAWHPTFLMIAVIWAVIFACGAAAFVMVHEHTPFGREYHGILAHFGFVIAMNLLWSILFFSFHMIAASSLLALIIALAALMLAGRIYPRSHEAAFLILPYAGWVFFAAYLTNIVAALNP